MTTDSEEIREIAIAYGAQVPFLRNSALATDSMGIEPVLIDVLEHLKYKESYSPKCLALLMPTSPFREVRDINMALKIFTRDQVSSVVSVTPAIANNNPHWMLKESNSGDVTLFNNKRLSEIKNRRQDLPEVFIRNDFVYVLDPKNLYKEHPGLYGDNIKLMKTSEGRLDVDINSQLDWDVAEFLFKKVVDKCT